MNDFFEEIGPFLGSVSRSPYVPPIQAPPRTGPKFTTEEVLPGVELNNYTKRVPDEDGKYVFITEHSERIELIPQPPTPEEIEAKRQADKKFAIIFGSVATVVVTVFGYALYREDKRFQAQQVNA